MKPTLSLLSLLLVFLTVNAQTYTKVFQPHWNGEDCPVSWMDSSCNSGNSIGHIIDSNWYHLEELGYMAWTNSSCPDWSRSLLRFSALSDTNEVPSAGQATITSATLTLYNTSYSATGNFGNSSYPGSPYPNPNRGYLYTLANNFNPLTVTWRTHPDYNHTDSVLIPPSTEKFGNDSVVLNVTSLVQSLHLTGNTGFYMKLQDEIHYRMRFFASSKYPDSTRHPKLQVTYNTTLGISQHEVSVHSPAIFPNPATNEIFISFLEPVSGQVIIANQFGQVLQTTAISGRDARVDIGTLPSGIYFLRVMTGRSTVERKFVKS
jgi:hypothetical protein